MHLRVTDNPRLRRVEIYADDELAGFTDYRQSGNMLTLPHTEIDGERRGSGIGGRLVRHVLDEARKRSLRVLPACPFVRAWLTRHPDYLDLVPADRRREFGLPGA